MIDTTNGYGATSTKSSEPPERDRQEYLKPDAGQRAFSYSIHQLTFLLNNNSTQRGASLYLALRFVRSDFNGNCPKQLKRCLEEFPNGDTGESIAKKVLSEANRSGVTNEELFNFILLTRPELFASLKTFLAMLAP